MRAFATQSAFQDGSLALALAPALTPAGLDPSPSFFCGFAAHPQVLARGLLVLADVTATRYFNYAPVAQRDPVLSAQGDRLRAECFSACNGVYARLDLLQSGFDGKIGFGTTNVDIGMDLRAALAQLKQSDRLHVDIGSRGLAVARVGSTDGNVSRLEAVVHERPVQMPNRWVRALGNAAEIHSGMGPVFKLAGPQAQVFVASLPPATSKNQAGWLTPSRTGVKLAHRRTPGSAYVSGLHRLSALKRVLTNLSGITFYMPVKGEPGPFMAVVQLPGARLVLSLTAEAWQGYSGEGALLESLAQPELLEDAEAIGTVLGFEAAVDALALARRWKISEDRAQAALALLATSGKLGFDAHDGAYFHRELPDDPDRVLKDNPRLVAAQKLVDAVERTGDHQWCVHSNETCYRVQYSSAEGVHSAKCTCTWYLNHLNKRGPCKHILAVRLRENEI